MKKSIGFEHKARKPPTSSHLIKKVGRRQKETLQLLRGSSCDPISYAGLQYCSFKRCGRRGCAEVCAFGVHRRRDQEQAAIHHLLSKRERLLHEVRTFRPHWNRDFGKLCAVSIAAGRHLLHRALDMDNTMVAVGMFKVAYHGDNWFCEIHAIVSGCNEVQLQQAFSGVRTGVLATVTPVKLEDLNEAISRVMNGDLVESFRDLTTPLEQRKEFVSWLAGMKVGERIIRYGCDKHFNLSLKPPKTMKPKVKKKETLSTSPDAVYVWVRREMGGD